MSDIIKVREHSSTEDKYIHRETSADIVTMDQTSLSSINGSNVQEIVENIDDAFKSVAHEKTITLTIDAKKFEYFDDHYEQNIVLDGIKSTDNPIAGLLLSEHVEKARNEMDAWGCIQRITCGDGFIVVYCYDDIPEININIQLKVIR